MALLPLPYAGITQFRFQGLSCLTLSIATPSGLFNLSTLSSPVNEIDKKILQKSDSKNLAHLWRDLAIGRTCKRDLWQQTRDYGSDL